MTKRKISPGERIVRKLQLADPSGLLAHSRAWRDKTARIIDAAIRRAQAAAWQACCKEMAEQYEVDTTDCIANNPYRKARRK